MPTHNLIDNVIYYFQKRGRGAPLVLLHGFTGSHANWQTIMPYFTTDYTVIAPDILGHGSTDAPDDHNRYRIEYVAADILSLMDNYETFNLLGYSMGGRLALYIATHHPERLNKLILESASPGLMSEPDRAMRTHRDNRLADRLESEGLQAFIDFWQSLDMWQSQAQISPDAAQKQREQRLNSSPIGLANSLRGMGTGRMPSLWHHLSEITVPTLLLSGALDTKFTQINRRMVETMPNAIHHEITAAGHNIHLEKPQEFSEHVNNFLKQ